ncbi:MAG TPA: trypsin-like peptidase domain-containing protein [Acetobacteraceae bacterium]|nr:trypsin-like peptidase domain-containing protein [Acetobacteraceae bacterium]
MTEPNTDRRRPRLRRTLAAALLASTTLGGLAAIPVLRATAEAQAQTQAAPETAQQKDLPPIAAPGPSTNGQAPVNEGSAMRERVPNFVALVKQVKPAVVTVTNYLKNGAAEDEGSDGNGPQQLPFPFNQFPFNQMPFGQGPFGQQMPHRAVEARGSGFIINPDGLIVTNFHVVKDEARLEVTLADGSKYPAKIVGTDPRTDIAVIRIDAHHPLPYLQLGDSQDVEPGQWVIAIGNPFGLSETVTAGIVSAVGRNIGAGPYDSFIQVDAPINRGNSGGPLITQDGKVVGMNTAILSPTGGSVGIGFAIPSDTIQRIASDLEHTGHVTRGYLGVEAQSVSDAMSKALGLPNVGGALIASVQPDTPAAHAGLQPGDVIEKVNGKEIKDPSQLALAISGIRPGHDATLDIMRDGHQETLNVRVAEMPSEQQTASNQGSGQRQEGRLGLALGPVSPDIASQLNLPDGTRGAVVQQVQPGSPAEIAGLQPGDVIVGVGTHKVNSPQQATAAIRDALQHDPNALALRIIRDGQPAFVAINLNNPNEQQSGNG